MSRGLNERGSTLAERQAAAEVVAALSRKHKKPVPEWVVALTSNAAPSSTFSSDAGSAHQGGQLAPDVAEESQTSPYSEPDPGPPDAQGGHERRRGRVARVQAQAAGKNLVRGRASPARREPRDGAPADSALDRALERVVASYVANLLRVDAVSVTERIFDSYPARKAELKPTIGLRGWRPNFASSLTRQINSTLGTSLTTSALFRDPDPTVRGIVERLTAPDERTAFDKTDARLALTHLLVGEVEPLPVVTAREGDLSRGVVNEAEGVGVEWVLLVKGLGEPLGWMSLHSVKENRLIPRMASGIRLYPVAAVDQSLTLNDALDALLTTILGKVVVLDRSGVAIGSLDIPLVMRVAITGQPRLVITETPSDNDTGRHRQAESIPMSESESESLSRDL